MAARQIKLRETGEPVPEVDDRLSQRKRPESGRYLLQVDRQTKASYTTTDAAKAAGLVIKTGHPVVQVSIYDSVECQNTLVELPAASK
ncbi:MAG: hypothetical protein QOC56_1964 [Alphaproteobacteria bacterium]|jgi:hypothetical protein|nr:hypothetical protein [Alphaproteobacteria bacterium]MEA2938460.1 hypothetical protein [Alphaproteobacteria bacterium]